MSSKDKLEVGVNLPETGIERFKANYYAIKEKVEEEAKIRYDNAAFNDLRSGDDGSGLLDEFNMLTMIIMNDRIPERYETWVKEINTEKDPEYQEFLRLKDKFGD